MAFSSPERGAAPLFWRTRRRDGAGNWQAIVQRDGRYLSRTFDTKADAEEWAGEIERNIRRGQFIDRRATEKTSLGEALDLYAEAVLPGKKGEYRERRRIEAWKRDPLAKRSLASIRGADVATWRDQRAADGASANTIRRDLTILSHLFTVARKEWKGFEGLLNPVEAIRQPSPGKARDRRFDRRPDENGKDEAARLVEACQASNNPYLALMVTLALETAMRQGELLALRWEHVDLVRRVASLPKTKNDHTRRDRTEGRDVPLSSLAVKTLKDLPRSIDGRVFPVSLCRLNIHWRKAVADAGATGLRFHDLRHEATSRLVERGLGIEEVRSITGHRTLAMLTRYTHLRAEDIAQKLG